MPLASIAATLPVLNNAFAAQPSAAEALDGDFESALASYMPANDFVQAAAAAPAKAVQSASIPEVQKPEVKEIKPVKGAPIVADPAKALKAAAKPGAFAIPDEEIADPEQVDAETSKTKPDVADSALAQATEPVMPQPIQMPVVIAVGPPVQQAVAQKADDAIEDEPTATAPANKLDSAPIAKPAAPVSADPAAVREQNPLATRGQNTPLEKQTNISSGQASNAPQPKVVNPVSSQAMDAIAEAAKARIQKPEAVAPAHASQAGIGSIAAMLNAVRGTITAIMTPKQTSAAQAEPKTGSKDTVKAEVKLVAVDAGAADQKSDTKSVVRSNAQLASIARTADQKSDAKNIVRADAKQASMARAGDPKPDAPQIQQDDTSDTSAQADLQSAQNVARDHSVPTLDKIAKPEAAMIAPATESAHDVTQSVANVSAVALDTTQNIGSALSSSSASGSERAAPNNAQASLQPNISALATTIAAKSAGGIKTFDIRMDPPELGRVDVHLSVDRDGKVQALLRAEHPQTLELLQRDSQNLERALKDAGLNLSNNSLNFSLKGEQRQGDGGGAFMARSRSLSDAVVARAEAVNASEINFSATRGHGRLDIRV